MLLVIKQCRDLGVIIADTSQPRLHINTIVAKASQRANAILRCFQSRDPCVLLYEILKWDIATSMTEVAISHSVSECQSDE